MTHKWTLSPYGAESTWICERCGKTVFGRLNQVEPEEICFIDRETVTALEVNVQGYSGEPQSLVQWEITATGVRYYLMGPLAKAVLEGR